MNNQKEKGHQMSNISGLLENDKYSIGKPYSANSNYFRSSHFPFHQSVSILLESSRALNHAFIERLRKDFLPVIILTVLVLIEFSRFDSYFPYGKFE